MNENKIVRFNIFDHTYFSEDIDKDIKRYKKELKKDGLTKNQLND